MNKLYVSIYTNKVKNKNESSLSGPPIKIHRILWLKFLKLAICYLYWISGSERSWIKIVLFHTGIWHLILVWNLVNMKTLMNVCRCNLKVYIQLFISFSVKEVAHTCPMIVFLILVDIFWIYIGTLTLLIKVNAKNHYTFYKTHNQKETKVKVCHIYSINIFL